MTRFITLLMPLALLLISDAFAGNGRLRKGIPTHFAGNRGSQKSTSNTNPVLAESVYDYSLPPAAQLTDSIRLIYSNGHGSAFDFDNLSYDYDNGADDPGDRLLVSSYVSFDSIHAYYPPRSSHYTTAAVRSYDAAGRVIQSFKDSAQIVYYNYDAITGRLASTVTALFNGSSYDTSIRHTYTYGIYGSVTRDSIFSRTGNTWKPARVIVSTNGNLSYPAQRTENVITGSTLTPLIRTNYTYYPSNRPSAIVYQRNIGGTNLRNAFKDSFTYASNNMLILYNSYSWDTTTATWSLNGEERRHLDPVFAQPDSVWSRYGNGSGGFDTSVLKLAYNDAGDPVYLRDYSAGGRTLTNEIRWYYRLTLTGIEGAPVSAAGEAISVYPNPAEGLLYVRGAATGMRYGIYNAAGQILQRGVLDASGTAPVAGLPAGTYIIRLEGKAGMQAATFIRR